MNTKAASFRFKHPTVTAAKAGDDTHPPIRSFALRSGHLSPAQQRAYEQGLPRWGLSFRTSNINLESLFGNSQPVVFEIGFGMGETTAAIAKSRPDINFLGAEVYTSGVGSLLKRIEEEKLTNIRIIQHDAVEVLRHMIAPASLQGVHIFFPDPWHKKRHHKRRLIQPDFVELLSSRLKPNAYVHCATDWEDYADQMLDVLASASTLKNTAPGFSPRPSYRPETKFEKRGIKLGHGVWDLIFTKIPI